MSKPQTKTLSSGSYFIHLGALGAPSMVLQISFADHASQLFAAYRDQYQFGASDMEDDCGFITNSENVVIGRISYNGRIWDAVGRFIE
jgi:hypothetical protein